MASKSTLQMKDLMCAVCSRLIQKPKLLKCMHFFCQECVASLCKTFGKGRKIKCPVCREITPVRRGDVKRLPTNKRIARIVEDIVADSKMCTLCAQRYESPAVRFCGACGEFLCTSCVDGHTKKTAKHPTVTMDDIKAGTVEAITKICPRHLEEKEYFCQTCVDYLCQICLEEAHTGPGHDVEDLAVSLKRFADERASLKRRIRAEADALRQAEVTRKLRARVQAIIDEGIKAGVHQAYDNIVQKINDERDRLIEECETRAASLMEKQRKYEEQRAEDVRILNAALDKVREACAVHVCVWSCLDLDQMSFGWTPLYMHSCMFTVMLVKMLYLYVALPCISFGQSGERGTCPCMFYLLVLRTVLEMKLSC